jgi:hypothetical protein
MKLYCFSLSCTFFVIVTFVCHSHVHLMKLLHLFVNLTYIGTFHQIVLYVCHSNVSILIVNTLFSIIAFSADTVTKNPDVAPIIALAPERWYCFRNCLLTLQNVLVYGP